VSQSFAVITAHCQNGRAEDWSKYAMVDTLVVLMGVKNRAFIAQSLLTAGRKSSEPVAFIERGTLPGEKIVETTLGAVAADGTQINSPAVFVIGDVVKLRGRIKGLAPALPEFAGQAQSGD
jgi:uroporphyrin-III C-methyltransferase